MEYECAFCGRLIVLVPHGNGRYAPPGQPPPHFVPEAERQPPWAGAGAPQRTQGAPAEAPKAHPGPTPEPPSAAPPEGPSPFDFGEAPPATEPPLEEPPLEEPPVGLAEALSLLGCSTSADRREVERAFRERSLTCHPDKVAHLDPEFQELAERKFKRLRAAYDLLLS